MGIEGRGDKPFDEQFEAGNRQGKPAEEEGRKSKTPEGLPPQGLPQQPEEKLVYDSHNNPAPYSPSNIGEEPQEEIGVKWIRLPPLAKEDEIRRISRILANFDKLFKDRPKDRPDSFDRIGGFGGHTIFPPGYIKEQERIRDQLLQDSEDQPDESSDPNKSRAK